MFSPLTYLEWINERHDAVEFDLASSVLPATPTQPDEIREQADRPQDETLSDAIAATYPTAEPSDVVVTAGASHANLLVAMAAITRANRDGVASPTVAVESPGYEPLVETPRGLGASIERVPRPADREYDVDLAALEDTVDEKTALVTITNRHNPSGRLLDRERLAEVAAVVSSVDATLLVDEVYAPLVLPDDRNATGAIGAPTAAGLPNTVVTQSLTKFFGAGGLRIGWIVADRSIGSTIGEMATHVPVVSHPSMELAHRILAEPRFEDGARDLLADNYALLEAFADRPDLTGQSFRGSSFAFLEHTSADGDEVAAASMEDDVLVVPGRFFGDRNRFRICVCQETTTVERGLDRLGAALDEL